jgi:hypothetical protein
MKPGYIFFFFTILSSLHISSCTKDASEESYVRLPKYVPKLAITAFVSPDQYPNTICITTTIARFGVRSFADPRPLKLYLFEDMNEVQFDTACKVQSIYDFNYYIKNFNFKEGRKYTLKVVSDSGYEASASCKIPLRHNFDIKVDTSSRKMTNEYGRNYLIPSARISIRDIPGEKNYYRMLLNYNTYRKQAKGSYSELLAPPVTPPEQWDKGDVMYNDEGKDGERIILRSIEFFSIDLGPNPHNIEYDSAFLKIYLLSTDKAYNDFHLCLHNYSLGDNAFTEPSFLYSNIEGGEGIFASYVVDSLIYRLK